MMMMNIRSKLSLQSIRSSPLRFMHATATATSEGVSGAVTEAASSTGQKVKHRVPQKRASKLLNELKSVEFEKLRNGREWPQIRAGDAIEVQRLDYVTAPEADVIKGVVITKTNRSSDTAVTLLNYEYGTPILRRIVLYGPLIKDVKVIQKAFIHKGLKRVRRSRLYYLHDRDPSEYTVKY